jgi:hypothetical protein
MLCSTTYICCAVPHTNTSLCSFLCPICHSSCLQPNIFYLYHTVYTLINYFNKSSSCTFPTVPTVHHPVFSPQFPQYTTLYFPYSSHSTPLCIFPIVPTVHSNFCTSCSRWVCTAVLQSEQEGNPKYCPSYCTGNNWGTHYSDRKQDPEFCASQRVASSLNCHLWLIQVTIQPLHTLQSWQSISLSFYLQLTEPTLWLGFLWSIQVHGTMMPFCQVTGFRRFEGLYRLHLQCKSVQEELLYIVWHLDPWWQYHIVTAERQEPLSQWHWVRSHETRMFGNTALKMSGLHMVFLSLWMWSGMVFVVPVCDKTTPMCCNSKYQIVWHIKPHFCALNMVLSLPAGVRLKKLCFVPHLS